MIIFQRLKIKDFKSIKEAELEYTAGVWQITGVNNDAVFKSNGSGKTTLIEAIQQCLFNKTTSPTPIEDTSRKSLGVVQQPKRGYTLELTFTDGKDDYRVVNDRKAMIIKIYKNGVDQMIKSIPSSLKYILSVIGMDYQTFVTLTFINHDTIVDLLDNFSSSSLMKIILNFAQISEFEKSAKTEQKALNVSLLSLSGRIQTINDSLGILDQFVKIDMRPMHQEKLWLAKSLQDLNETVLVNVEEHEQTVGEVRDKIELQIQKHAAQRKRIASSKCHCCGTLLEMTEEEREKLVIESTLLEDRIVQSKLICSEAETIASQLREMYSVTAQEITEATHDVEQKITIARTKNELYETSKTQADDLRKNLQELLVEQETADFRLVVIKTALSVVKSGDIQKDLLEAFVTILNLHLAKFITFVSLDYVTISAEASKANVAFKIHDTRFNHAISIHTLSGGEKTRLRLVVLLAMLYTIKEMAAISSNILVFDESLDTLDASAAEDLANLFSYLVNHDNKFIALVSHGAQLSAIEFSGTLLAEKSNGVTTIRRTLL